MNFFENRGFTLIELIAAMVLMALFVFFALKQSDTTIQSRKREKFFNAVDRVLTHFRAARADAVANRLVNGIVPEGGYGVFLNRQSPFEMRVVRFVDDHDAAGTDAPAGNKQFDDGFDTVLAEEIISTPWNWNFQNTDPAPDPIDTFSLFFFSPDAKLRLSDNTPASDIRKTEMFFDFNGKTSRKICLNRISRFFEVIGGDTACF